MPTDPSPPLPRRKPSALWWIAAAFLLLFGLFLFQLFGPNRPIVVSKQTTYITEPLLPNGLPDYRAYFERQQRAGVTPENNAAVLMWQAFGPGTGSDAVVPADWQRITKELHLPPTASNATFVDSLSKEVAVAVGDWILMNSNEWQSAIANDPSYVDLRRNPEDVGWDAVGNALESPWKSEDLPDLAAWAQANKSALDLFVTAADRPRFYTPLPLPDDPKDTSLIASFPMNDIQRARSIARSLVARAMLNLGEGRHAESWRDLFAIHRWARLVGQRPTLVDQLVAIAIDGIACEGTEALLADVKLPTEVARQVQQDLASLSPPCDVAKSFDEGERLYFVDIIVHGSRVGVGTFLIDSLYVKDAESLRPLDYISVDWNVTLAKGNDWYDRLAAACRRPTRAARYRDFQNISNDLQILESQLGQSRTYAAAAINPSTRANTFAAAVISRLITAFDAAQDSEDHAIARLELTGLAAALAVYRANHNEYPASLSTLVPDVIPQLPTDIFTGKPFVYRRIKDGYVLYSLGENGVDEGGSNEMRSVLAGRSVYDLPQDEQEATAAKIPPGADDISIRVPRPSFRLPSPSANP